MKHVGTILVILFLLFSNCQPIESPTTTLYVTAKSGLVLREKPDQKSATVAILPYAESVEVIATTDHESVIEGVRAKWIETHFQEKRAFAFSGFLGPSQPTVLVSSAISPSRKRRFTLENLGPATMSYCQNHYSATCVLKVFEGDKLLYQRQGDAAIRWTSDTMILLRQDLGDAGYTGSTFSVLDVTTEESSPLCSFGSYSPIGIDKPDFQIQYNICGKNGDCEIFKVTLKAIIEHSRSRSQDTRIVENFPVANSGVGFDGQSCYFTSGSRNFKKP